MTTTSITSVSPPIRRTEMPFLLPKPTRIFLLAFFCYVQLLCSMVLNGFFTIVKQVAAFYGVSVQLVNLMGTIVYLYRRQTCLQCGNRPLLCCIDQLRILEFVPCHVFARIVSTVR